MKEQAHHRINRTILAQELWMDHVNARLRNFVTVVCPIAAIVLPRRASLPPALRCCIKPVANLEVCRVAAKLSVVHGEDAMPRFAAALLGINISISSTLPT
jgi:hypothetical protein